MILDCRMVGGFVPSILVSPIVQSKTIDSQYKTRLLIFDFGPLTVNLDLTGLPLDFCLTIPDHIQTSLSHKEQDQKVYRCNI